jgi:hypothetical protein
MKGWRLEGLTGWKAGRMKGWKFGRLEGWQACMQAIEANFIQTVRLPEFFYNEFSRGTVQVVDLVFAI